MPLTDDLKRPINLLSLSIGILSLFASLLFFLASQKSRVPAYIIDENKAQVFDSSISSPAIKVLDKDNSIIKDDIYLATIKFWNAGEIPIEPEHVRSPVKIQISPIKKIIDFSILEQTEPAIAGIEIKKIETNDKSDSCSELELSWKHLDPNFGARIQIMYIGSKNAEICFDGKILGVDEFKNGLPLGKRYKLISSIFGIFVGMLISIVISMFVSAIKKRERKDLIIFTSTTVVVTIFIISFYFMFIRGLSPPV